MELTKEELSKILSGANDLAMLSTLNFLNSYLEEAFKAEVPVYDGSNSARRLDAMEILVGLQHFISLGIAELSKKITAESSKEGE